MEVSEQFYQDALLIADYQDWINGNRYYREDAPCLPSERERAMKRILETRKG